MRGVSVGVHPVDSGQNGATFTGVLILGHLLEVVGDPPFVLYDSSASGTCLRGEVSSLFEPSILIVDRKVKTAQDYGESGLRGKHPGGDNFEMRLFPIQ
eukprot:10692420-Heterocapsa_arctica.AAC.1